MKRVTFMLAPDNEKSLRKMQAETIKETGNSYSFSAAINDRLRGVKK